MALNHEQTLELAKVKNALQKKKKAETEAQKEADTSQLATFIGDLDKLLAQGIDIRGADNIELLVESVEKFGERTAYLLDEIRKSTTQLHELELPETITLKTITDNNLLDALAKVGDNGELLSKIQSLDQAILLLQNAISTVEKAGQKPEDAQPVRIVLGRDDSLKFLEQWPTPIFNGGSSTGLTDAQLRASPVPVSASIDTTGLATETKQDTLIGHVDGLEALVTSTNTKLDTLNTTTTAIVSKPTDAYSIAAISDDGTYKYFWFEDASLNYYIMRKTIATSVFLYTKGTGGYSAVYQSSILGPSGSPTWGTYGATF